MKKNTNTSKTNIPKNSSLIIFLFLISLTVWLIFLYFGFNSVEKGFGFAYSTSYGLDAFLSYILVSSLIGFPILIPTIFCIINYFRKYWHLSLICKRYFILCLTILVLKTIVVFSSAVSLELYEIQIFNFNFTINLPQIILLIIIILAFILIVISLIWRYIDNKKRIRNNDN